MSSDLPSAVRNVIYYGKWNMQSMPEEVEALLDEIMAEFPVDDILAELESRRPALEEDERKTSDMGSCMGGDMHLSAMIALRYLEQSVAYIQSKTKG
uniref:hypothetical protein n=1 Tax=Thaumasiovibrio occultus TaxID=1891184 RepID=UPI00131DF0EA|nr:hypothetical protein [Thaumasiovibrio occultus]